MFTYRSGMSLAPYRYRIIVANNNPSPGGSINVFNAANDVLLSDTQVNNVLTQLKTFYSALSSYIGGTYSIGSRILEFRPGGVAPRIVLVAPQSQANTVSGPQPPQLAAVLSWRTALAGKSFRGRTFLGPLNSAALSGTSLAGAFTAAANTAAAALIANVRTQTSASWGLVVHSDERSEDTQISLGNMDSRVDTIRSRA